MRRTSKACLSRARARHSVAHMPRATLFQYSSALLGLAVGRVFAIRAHVRAVPRDHAAPVARRADEKVRGVIGRPPAPGRVRQPRPQRVHAVREAAEVADVPDGAAHRLSRMSILREHERPPGRERLPVAQLFLLFWEALLREAAGRVGHHADLHDHANDLPRLHARAGLRLEDPHCATVGRDHAGRAPGQRPTICAVTSALAWHATPANDFLV